MDFTSCAVDIAPRILLKAYTPPSVCPLFHTEKVKNVSHGFAWMIYEIEADKHCDS